MLSAMFGIIVITIALTLQAQQIARSPALVFLHVTVINPGSSSVAKDRAVVIEQGRVTAVADAAAFVPPAKARVVDGTDKFLIPGLWDMHVHGAFGDWFPRGREVILPLFIANGVTGVRDMGGDLPVLFAWRKQIASGVIPGPRMVVSGPMLDGYLPGGKKTRFPSSIAVMNASEAVKAVDLLKSQGVDFIKVQSVLAPDLYAAAAEEAHRRNLPFVGHVPDHIKITTAVSLGQKSVQHLMGVLEGCSSQEDRLLKGVEDTKLLLSSYEEPAGRVVESNRFRAPATGQVCARLLAQRDMEALLRRDDTGCSGRFAAVAKAIHRTGYSHDRIAAQWRSGVSGRNRHGARDLCHAGLQSAR